MIPRSCRGRPVLSSIRTLNDQVVHPLPDTQLKVYPKYFRRYVIAKSGMYENVDVVMYIQSNLSFKLPP